MVGDGDRIDGIGKILGAGDGGGKLLGVGHVAAGWGMIHMLCWSCCIK